MLFLSRQKLTCTAKDKVAALKEMVEAQRQLIESEFKTIESNVEFFVEDAEKPAALVPAEIQDNIINAIYAVHNGVLAYDSSLS